MFDQFRSKKDRLISALEQLKTLVPSEKVSRVAAIDGKRLKGFGEETVV